MSYQYDLSSIIKGNNRADNFGTQLLRLIMKADSHNLSLLRKSFPNAVIMVEHWRESMSGEILDLPYD